MADAVYDHFAKEYQDSKLLPFRLYVEGPSLFALLGDLRGKSVLDLGCGDGIYARKLKEAGSATVVGVDVSKEMIALALEKEAAAKLGIRYEVCDAREVDRIGSFDVVLGSYLLNYAKSPADLSGYVDAIKRNLAPGGRFVGINDNPANDPKNYGKYRPYGFVKATPAARKEGDPVTYRIYNADGTHFEFDNYWLAPETYAKTFAAAGFREFRWVAPKLSHAGVETFGAAFWTEFLADPPIIALEARL